LLAMMKLAKTRILRPGSLKAGAVAPGA
jgi:hypothetical protein